MEISIVPARAENVESINKLIRASKSYWNYPDAYLDKSIMLLMIGSSYLADNTAFEIRMNEELVGFFAFAMKGSERHLDHLWIAPKHIKTGIGRQALLYTDNLAHEQGWIELLTYPDPPAEAFYFKNGYIDTGRRIPSRIEGGPQFAVFSKTYR